MTWMRQPSRQGIALFSVRMEFWRTRALYNSPFSTRWFVLTFGTDSSLVVAPGWDNVTGLGTPNGVAFVNAIAP